MNYEETINYLFNSLPVYQRIGKAAYKANLDTSLALDDYFGSPHNSYKTIHIAGTNGKGSVSNSLASILQESGMRTGLYTSPHLRDFRERIRVDGELISKDYVVDFVENNKSILKELEASFFEMTVAMAFQYFKDSNVEIAVIETGMGGRLDSTNIIRPLVSVITNISLDHTQFLGNTIKEIAAEKAGIIKESVPVIIGRSDDVTVSVFNDVASKRGCDLVFADRDFLVECIGLDYSKGSLNARVSYRAEIEYENLEVNFAARYQLENIATTLSVCKELDSVLSLQKENIVRGLKNIVSNTGLEGRWQIIENSPFIVTDIAHNYDGLKLVMDQVESLRSGECHFVLGFVDDKDLDLILRILPDTGEYYFTRASIPRSLDEELLRSKAQSFGIEGKAYNSLPIAYKEACSNAAPEDLIYVGGSTFIVADLLDYLNQH